MGGEEDQRRVRRANSGRESGQRQLFSRPAGSIVSISGSFLRGLTVLVAILDHLALLTKHVQLGLVDGRTFALKGFEVTDAAGKVKKERGH